MRKALDHGLAPSWVFGALTLLSLVAYGALVWIGLRYGTLRDQVVPQTVSWYAVAFVAYLGILAWSQWQRVVPARSIWLPAVVFRLLLLLTVPTLSDDVYRYLWDGHVASHGISPYAFPIDDPALDGLDIGIRGLANNRWMASPYLPAAQWVFHGTALLFPLKPIFLQGAMVLFDLLAAGLIARLLAVAALPARYLLIYLWNPLVVVETAHGAHVDAWMVLLTLLAIWLALEPGEGRVASLRRQWLSPFALALATLTKPLPVLLLPVFVGTSASREETASPADGSVDGARRPWRWWSLATYGTVLAGLLVPAAAAAGWGLQGPLDGRGLFGALRIYDRLWNFNSGLFHWLEQGLTRAGVDPANLWSKVVVALLMLAVLAIVWRQARSGPAPRALLRLMAVPFMAYVLLNTTVHPWYLVILLAFLAFQAPAETGWPRRSCAIPGCRAEPAIGGTPPAPPGGILRYTDTETAWRWLILAPWLYLSGALVLSYLTYSDPLDFRELEWVRLWEWLPVYGLLLGSTAWLLLRHRMPRHRRS